MSATIAAQGPAPAHPFSDRLFGDWGGERLRLAQRGISFELTDTSFYQGPFSGTGSKDFEFGNRFDLASTLDTTKLGWWKGGYLRFHAETFGGGLSSRLGGSLLPTNSGMILPIGGRDQVTISNLSLIQAFNPTTTVTLGRISTPDLLASDPVFGGLGTARFQHLAFVAPPNGLLPPVIYGAIFNQSQTPLGYTFMVYDPNDQSQRSLPNGLFQDGVNLSGSVKLSSSIAGRAATYTLNAIYSTADSLDLRDAFLPPGYETRVKRGSWHGSLQFNHALRAGLNLALKAGISDGNPNPFQSFVTAGVVGRGLAPRRPSDSFGLGYFRYQFSRDLRQAIEPLIRVRDEEGIEAFYDFSLAPGAGLAVDLQYVRPADGRKTNLLAGGLRLRLQF